jgi:DNA-binding LytR/AlgR family response regulator
MKFKYLIVDDEPLARKLIAAHASKVEGLESVGECGNAIEAANLLRNKSVDLIFLDIQMPEMTGFQFASTLKNPPAIILTTAFRDYAPEAFDLNVVDYLLKPISFERLLKSVNKFFDRQTGKKESVTSVMHEEQRFVHIKADRKIHKVSEAEILYIESLDDYVKVHLKETVLVTRENISTLEEKLPSPPFVRIHRSFIININWVKTISNEGIELNGKELPFGRAFKKSALNQLSVKPMK